MNNPLEWVVALGLGAVVVEILRAIFQRQKVKGDTAAILSAAARELVEPLHHELARERQEHAANMVIERDKIQQLRIELDAALVDMRTLRRMVETLQDENLRYRTRYGPLPSSTG